LGAAFRCPPTPLNTPPPGRGMLEAPGGLKTLVPLLACFRAAAMAATSADGVTLRAAVSPLGRGALDLNPPGGAAGRRTLGAAGSRLLLLFELASTFG
jgi:hypothetical protein